MIKKVLTIAGSDSSGGAGIQADLKTFEEYGTFGFSSITCVVTMDPCESWSHTVTPLSPLLVEKQLKTVYAGAPLNAVKTGMLGSVETIEIAQHFLKQYNQSHLVVDPVIACKGTSELLQPENVEAMKKLLLPLAEITTPNLIEAGILSGLGELTSVDDMKAAAVNIKALGVNKVIVKGGKRIPGTFATDVYYDGKDFILLQQEKIETTYNHGAGCTFAAAITAGLAKGFSTLDAIKLAKDFVSEAIEEGFSINPYLGHVWHGAYNHAEQRMKIKTETE